MIMYQVVQIRMPLRIKELLDVLRCHGAFMAQLRQKMTLREAEFAWLGQVPRGWIGTWNVALLEGALWWGVAG